MTQLTPIEELRYAMKQTTDKRLFERYQAVFLHFNGQTNIEIAEIIQRSRVTVGSYIRAYKKGGLVGLHMGTSSGKSPDVSGEQRTELGTLITEKMPSDVGFSPYTNWTLVLLVAWVAREWSVTYSLRGMSKLLERMGFSYTRPTYTLAKADPEKQKHFTEETF